MTDQEKFESPLYDYVQYGAVFDLDPEDCDPMADVDKDGDWIASCRHQEHTLTITGIFCDVESVSVLVPPGMDVSKVLRALAKIREWIERDGLYNPKGWNPICLPVANRPIES